MKKKKRLITFGLIILVVLSLIIFRGNNDNYLPDEDQPEESIAKRIITPTEALNILSAYEGDLVKLVIREETDEAYLIDQISTLTNEILLEFSVNKQTGEFEFLGSRPQTVEIQFMMP